MSNNPTTPVDELTAKIRFVLDKYYISNPLPSDDADIDMSITDLALLFETYKLPSIHMNDVNGIDCPACGADYTGPRRDAEYRVLVEAGLVAEDE